MAAMKSLLACILVNAVFAASQVSAIIVTNEWKVPISLTDTVIIGDTIIWSWADTAPHDLTCPDVGNTSLGATTVTSTPVPLSYSSPPSSNPFPTTIVVAGGVAAAAVIIAALALALLCWKRQRSRRRPSARRSDSDEKAFDPTQAPTLPTQGSSGPVSRGLLDNWSDSGHKPGPVLSDSYSEERIPKPQPAQSGSTQRPPEPELQGQYTLQQLQAATNHFSESGVIGSGSFGVVYKGVLADGSVVAVKRLRNRFGLRQSEEKLWRTEVEALGKMRQKNLVSLLGVCLEGDERLLIFEFFPRGSLKRRLHEPREGEPVLTWAERMCIIRGICRGLSYLHHDLRPPVLHRDIKAANVLLTDEDPLEACIADFGLAHFVQDVGNNTSTMVKGTVPYMAPEYLHGGARFLSPKCDVYSFGVLLLEIISGQPVVRQREDGTVERLSKLAAKLVGLRREFELVDPKLGTEYDTQEAMCCIHVAMACLEQSAHKRPTMEQLP